MSTITTQIIIGEPHPNHSGILPSHYIFLFENDRPNLTMVDDGIFNKTSNFNITWIPTVKNLIDDIMLMVTLYAFQDMEIKEIFESKINPKNLNFIDLSIINKNQLSGLHELNKQNIKKYKYKKVIFSIFKESTLNKQLKQITKYDLSLEVCKTVYSVLYSKWTENPIIEGDFK